MENKKTYWTIGIVAVVLIVLLLGFGVYSRNTNTQPQNHSSNSSSTGMNHTNNNSNTASQTNGTDKTTSHADPLTKYLKDQDEIMTEMMEDMNEETHEDHSGNAAVAFLEGMIPHHEAAVEMAESYLEHGGNHSDLKQLAADIIEVQTREIEEMDRLEDELELSGTTNPDHLKAYLDDFTKMISEHEQQHLNNTSAKNIDQAFTEGMLMHHRMGINMAKAIVDRTDHSEVKKLAQTIIKTQEKEIKLMEKLF